MKKLAVIAMLAIAASVSSADVITNHVYVVSNIYTQVFSEHVVTQKVQSTHYEYYFTNNVYWVTNVTRLVSQTNQTVYLDVGKSYLLAASNQANRAEAAVGSAQSVVGQAAQSANAAASSASAASASAASASATRSAAANECASALATINARINWFDEHSGETITQVNYNTNIEIHVAQTIVTNDFRHVPYDLDPNLEINLNEFAILSKGGTQNVYRVSAPGSPYLTSTSGGSMGSISLSSFDMRFDRFELLNGKAKFWYKADYFAGMAYNGNCVTWRFKWAYHYNGVWHVAIDQETYSNFDLTGVQTFEMTLSAAYPSGTGTFSNRPSSIWAASNSSHGRLTVPSYSTAMKYVAQMEVRDNVVHDLAALRESLTAMVQQSFDRIDDLEDRVSGAEGSLESRIDAVSNAVDEVCGSVSNLSERIASIESGSPHKYEHGGTTYNNVTVYSTPTDEGKVKVTPGSSSAYATVSYLVTPSYRYPTTTASTWVFRPAYVDSDASGLRLQFVCEEMSQISFSSSARSRMVVPEYLYWQNGYVYMKIKTFTDGVQDGSVVGRVADANFPNTYSTAKTISKTSGDNWSSSNVATIKTNTQMNPAGSAVWFPASASSLVLPIITWMVTGK